MTQPANKRLVTEAAQATALAAKIDTSVANSTFATKSQQDTNTAAIATKISKDATGYAGAPAFVQDATLSPAEVDRRPVTAPSRDASLTPDSTVVYGERRNKWQYTEDVASNRYAVGGSGTAKTTDTITVNGITLTRITASNFYGSLRSQLSSIPLPILTVGNRYLLSCYALSRRDVEQFVWMRDRAVNAAAGHGQRLLQPNRLTRLWNLVQAVSTTTVGNLSTPTDPWGTTGGDPYWLFQGNADGGALDVYVGGFQIEDVGTTALDGIAAIGDSTIQGSSGTADSGTARETVGYLAGLLNATTFNRGVGGQTTAQMDARWATDITPIKHRCKYVIIQGGINDIVQGRTLTDIQTSILSMQTKALADGLIPVFLTCTPTQSIAANATFEALRNSVNVWMKQTFPRVIDIAPVVADPFDGKYLRRTPGGVNGWYGDGVHYTQSAKRAVAERIAAWTGWELPTPTPYQKITAATWAPYGGVVVVSPNGTKYKLTVSDAGVLTATAV